jgi:hypothetical protein
METIKERAERIEIKAGREIVEERKKNTSK